MKAIWNGDIFCDGSQVLRGITIAQQEGGTTTFPADAKLRFLSIVETARIPLYMTVGPPHHVTTSSLETEDWLSSILLNSTEDEANSWWNNAKTDSPLGILVGAEYAAVATVPSPRPRTTEFMLYASNMPTPHCRRPPTPPQSSPLTDSSTDLRVEVLALPLSSDLLCSPLGLESSPPSSPLLSEADFQAVFLPPVVPLLTESKETVNELQPKKRRSVNDAFDEATERKRKARRKGGEGVSAAAASQAKTEGTYPGLKHRRSISSNQVHLQTRPLSRASSTSSSRPPAAREPSVPAVARPSGLSRIQSISAPNDSPEQLSLEQKNKEYVSKMVMAGMRLQGLVQTKTRKSRTNSSAASPAVDTSFDELEADRRNDEEYKLIYHQVYKGTCFAFRQYITTIALQSHTIPLQETVDRLLGVFLSDPLSVTPKVDEEEFTPGGRKAFGSSMLPRSQPHNPFLAAPAAGADDSAANTPSLRKSKNKEKGATSAHKLDQG